MTAGRSLLSHAASVIRVTVFSTFVTGHGSSCLFQRTLDSKTKEWGENGKGDGWAKFTYPRRFSSQGDCGSPANDCDATDGPTDTRTSSLVLILSFERSRIQNPPATARWY